MEKGRERDLLVICTEGADHSVICSSVDGPVGMCVAYSSGSRGRFDNSWPVALALMRRQGRRWD